MHAKRWLPLLLCAVLSNGCFHQVVQTGKPPGKIVVEHWFVSTWAWGLIPAKPIDVRRECPGGVATIMTEQSLVNTIITVLTIGIYVPRHVRVTCALQTSSTPPGAAELTIPADVSDAETSSLVQRAMERVAETGVPVVLRF